ncbi:MAG: amino acid permease [Brevibacterium aurantiacum]|uniref:Gamma-aminobutyrate permease n=1 Tax=Brevibacterium aurantiacum TaxID=273384 RepID=A0A2A3X883_BREAU|nr:amino acid permease [Brevibacterium aurantiacum]PCC19687.1 gamma-aminobutyrate permease [Brevibacterium aurantiacum]SMX85428.1 lysine:proton symporter, AAT family [Brevibacterium aurantiacum]
MNEAATSAGESRELKRGLKSRHLQMIAIGGAIGTGLFLGSGGTISQAGPGGALLAYAVIGIMVLFVMQSLGEMSTHLPVAGSFHTYGSKYVSPSFGFAMGWNYWFNWAITLAAELVAAGVIMSFWLPDVPSWVWAAIFLALLTGLNFLSAKAFGEGEFWFAAIKVTAVLAFLVLGVLMIAGIIGGESPGMSNWTRDEAPFVGGWVSIISVFMIAGFSFQGTELVGVTAGESANPRRDMPRAIRTVFWRIMLFYIGAIIIIGFLLPYSDPSLLASANNEDVTASPFTLVFERAGIAVAASVMNAVILTAILSAGNSGLYASTRMLYAMAKEGTAPRLFARLNERGVPVMALLATAVIGLFGFLSEVMGDGGAYTWLINVSGLSGFIVWVGIAWCHFRFRRAYVKQGHDIADLPYRAPLFPIGPIIALVMLVIVIIGQNVEAIVNGRVLEVASAYIGLPAFLLLWLIHRLVTGRRSSTVALNEMDVEGLEIRP